MIESALPLLFVLAAIITLGATGNLLSAAPGAVAAQVMAVALSVWARRSFRKGTFRASATPSDGAILRSGPYRFVRHPMYSAMLLFVWAAVVIHWSGLTAAIGCAVTIVIVARVVVEERLLRAQYPEYAEYARAVKGVIPFLL